MMITSRDEWIFNEVKNPMEDKGSLINQYIIQMLNKTTRIFKYNNLPDTIPQKDFEIILQVGGHGTLAVAKDNLYCFRSGLGGTPNPYYLPTISTVANPALNFSENLVIDKNCVNVLNDYFYQGMMPLFNKYANLLTEAEISLRYAIINARIPAIITADSDNSYASAEQFFKKIEDGKGYGSILTRSLFEGIKSSDFYKEHYIKDIIESIQYIKGSWYNEIGLNAAFNMKREAINEAEATLNEDILYPTIDNMLECRRIGVEKANKMFKTNITVELDSVWLRNIKREELILKKEEIEIKTLKDGDNIENT